MAKTAPFWQQKTYIQRNILLEERFCCDRNVGIDFVFDLFLKSLFNKYRGNQCRMGHWVTLKANKIQTDLGKKRILQSLKTHAGISFIPICECWMKSGSCRIEILEKRWRKYWTQGREDSGIRFWHPESVSLMSPAFVKLGSPCALSWWLRFGTVLTSCCNLWKELPSGGAWSVGSIGLLLWGVVWLLGNLRNIVHIPQMKLKISENLIIWKFQWRSQISLHLCFWNKMCDVSHCFCMFFFHLKGRWCWSHPRWSWRVSEWTSLVDPRLETSWEVWSHRGE